MLLMLASMAHAKDPGCWVPGKIPYVGRTDIKVMTGAEAQQWEAERAANELRQPNPVPANGFAILTIGRSSIDLANESNHTIVVASNGVEVGRIEGATGVASVPEKPSGVYKYWKSTIVAPIPDTATFPVIVYAIDKPTVHRCAWSIEADGRATLLKDGGPTPTFAPAPQ